MKKNGSLDLKFPPPNDDVKNEIITAYESGESTYYIGKIHNFDAGKIGYWLTKWGVNKRLQGFHPGHSPSTKKDRKTDGFGYILIRMPDHPNAVRGFVREHRYVMEQKLGRLLQSAEVVHHINNNPADNRPENLEVQFIGDHTRDHRVALGRLESYSGRSKVITLTCDCCGRTYKRKIIKLCRPCRAPSVS